MLAYLALSVFPAALLIAAVNDIYEFKIPNWASIILIVAYPAAGVALGAPVVLIIQGCALAGAALVIGFALFATKVLGAGDAKLFAASAPWIGLAGLPIYLVYTTLSGAFLAFVLLLFRNTPLLPVYAQAQWLMRLHQNKKEIPYAVAIAVGGLLSFSETPFFQLAFGG